MMEDEDKKRHIVVVDDEPVNLDLAENALGGQYKLTKLISGEQLLKFLNRVKPDMILLDVQMPGMNGYEVMKKIRENEATDKVPVIFLTGQEGVYSEREGFRLGAKDFIKKPFDNEIMQARVRSQMELHVYHTDLERIIEQKTAEITDLQHVLTISWAEMIESRDGTTGSHVRNTTAYFEILLEAMRRNSLYAENINDDILSELYRASTLHDIGKIGISDTILKKPGPLDRAEFETMKTHSRIGADMIDKIISETYFDSFLRLARDMALYHHERWDGTGYPCGLRGTEIPFYVRALSIVDVYDALTSVRPYKKAFTHNEALGIINHDSGKFFDPEIFDMFMQNEKAIAELGKGA